MEQTLRLVAVRSAGAAVARRIAAAIQGQPCDCRLTDGVETALSLVEEGQPIDVLIVPAEQMVGQRLTRLHQAVQANPLLRVVVTYGRLQAVRAHKLAAGGFHAAVAAVTAGRELAAMVDRLLHGPIPSLAMPELASDEDRRLTEAKASRGLAGQGQAVAVFGEDAPVLNLLAETLCAYGFQARTSQRMEGITEWLRAGRFQAAIFDAEAADAYACRIVRACRSAAPDVPVLVLAGFADPDDASTLEQAGAAACVRKPYDLCMLLWELRAALRNGPEEPPVLVSGAEREVLLGPAGKKAAI